MKRKNLIRLVLFLFIGITLGWVKDTFNLPTYKKKGDFFYFQSIFSDTITLIQKGDECGEFGGNLEMIKIFNNSTNTKDIFDKADVLASYSLYDDCGNNPPIEKMKPLESFISCDLSEKDMKAILSAIEELINMRLENMSFISHSGKINMVIAKDSSIIIRDYPSSEWKGFKKLRSKLIKRKC